MAEVVIFFALVWKMPFPRVTEESAKSAMQQLLLVPVSQSVIQGIDGIHEKDEFVKIITTSVYRHRCFTFQRDQEGRIPRQSWSTGGGVVIRSAGVTNLKPATMLFLHHAAADAANY